MTSSISSSPIPRLIAPFSQENSRNCLTNEKKFVLPKSRFTSGWQLFLFLLGMDKIDDQGVPCQKEELLPFPKERIHLFHHIWRKEGKILGRDGRELTADSLEKLYGPIINSAKGALWFIGSGLPALLGYKYYEDSCLGPHAKDEEKAYFASLVEALFKVPPSDYDVRYKLEGCSEAQVKEISKIFLKTLQKQFDRKFGDYFFAARNFIKGDNCFAINSFNFKLLQQPPEPIKKEFKCDLIAYTQLIRYFLFVLDSIQCENPESDDPKLVDADGSGRKALFHYSMSYIYVTDPSSVNLEGWGVYLNKIARGFWTLQTEVRPFLIKNLESLALSGDKDIGEWLSRASFGHSGPAASRPCAILLQACFYLYEEKGDCIEIEKFRKAASELNPSNEAALAIKTVLSSPLPFSLLYPFFQLVAFFHFFDGKTKEWGGEKNKKMAFDIGDSVIHLAAPGESFLLPASCKDSSAILAECYRLLAAQTVLTGELAPDEELELISFAKANLSGANSLIHCLPLAAWDLALFLNKNRREFLPYFFSLAEKAAGNSFLTQEISAFLDTLPMGDAALLREAVNTQEWFPYLAEDKNSSSFIIKQLIFCWHDALCYDATKLLLGRLIEKKFFIAAALLLSKCRRIYADWIFLLHEFLCGYGAQLPQEQTSQKIALELQEELKGSKKYESRKNKKTLFLAIKTVSSLCKNSREELMEVALKNNKFMLADLLFFTFHEENEGVEEKKWLAKKLLSPINDPPSYSYGVDSSLIGKICDFLIGNDYEKSFINFFSWIVQTQLIDTESFLLLFAKAITVFKIEEKKFASIEPLEGWVELISILYSKKNSAFIELLKLLVENNQALLEQSKQRRKKIKNLIEAYLNALVPVSTAISLWPRVHFLAENNDIPKSLLLKATKETENIKLLFFENSMDNLNSEEFTALIGSLIKNRQWDVLWQLVPYFSHMLQNLETTPKSEYEQLLTIFTKLLTPLAKSKKAYFLKADKQFIAMLTPAAFEASNLYPFLVKLSPLLSNPLDQLSVDRLQRLKPQFEVFFAPLKTEELKGVIRYFELFAPPQIKEISSEKNNKMVEARPPSTYHENTLIRKIIEVALATTFIFFQMVYLHGYHHGRSFIYTPVIVSVTAIFVSIMKPTILALINSIYQNKKAVYSPSTTKGVELLVSAAVLTGLFTFAFWSDRIPFTEALSCSIQCGGSYIFSAAMAFRLTPTIKIDRPSKEISSEKKNKKKVEARPPSTYHENTLIRKARTSRKVKVNPLFSKDHQAENTTAAAQKMFMPSFYERLRKLIEVTLATTLIFFQMVYFHDYQYRKSFAYTFNIVLATSLIVSIIKPVIPSLIYLIYQKKRVAYSPFTIKGVELLLGATVLTGFFTYAFYIEKMPLIQTLNHCSQYGGSYVFSDAVAFHLAPPIKIDPPDAQPDREDKRL